MPVPSDILFSDIKQNLTPHPATGDLARNVNLDAIKASVRNLVLTEFYDRPFKPNIGSNVMSYLFEPISPVTEENIGDAITEVIENYEPRAELLNVQVHAYPDDNGYSASIIFRAVNNTQPTQMDIFLERIR